MVERRPARTWMPASRVRTSRQRRPSTPMRARASSRRLPTSTPEVTSGIGMSRWMRYTRTQGGTSASSRATWPGQNTAQRTQETWLIDMKYVHALLNGNVSLTVK